VTGVAGPDPQDGHPVGQVYVGICGPDGSVAVEELSLDGDRREIRQATVEAALTALLRAIPDPV
jgi:nicotinamide-nucleotide amidase